MFPTVINLTSNFNKVTIGNLTMWFSYETMVAFQFLEKLVVHQNDWTTTTGKHLNLISADKKLRVNHQIFLVEWFNIEKLRQEEKEEIDVASDLLEEKGFVNVAKILRGISLRAF